MTSMDWIVMICLLTGLNVYVAAVVFLSRLKEFYWGLLLPTMMAVVAGYELANGYMQTFARRDGVLVFSLMILAGFGYVLYTVVHFGERKD